MDREPWKSGSTSRGTLDIVWSALVTLGLCVWTAIHPNIQLHPSMGHDLAVRILLMVTAVVFPEILISAAWHQKRQAEKLFNRLGSKSMEYQATKTSSQESLVITNTESDDSTWTLTHAYLVVMGGFAFQHTLDGTQNRYFFTIDGFQILHELGLGPQLTLDDIRDRSKADVVAKLIVVFQVLWFAMQVIARLISKIAITALEIHTIVHVGCAILMYILWFKKPYNISRCLFVQDDKSAAIGSLFLFHSIINDQHEKAVKEHQSQLDQYWEKRAVAGGDRELIDHDPPPSMPKMVSLTQALATYTSGDIESQINNPDELLLRSLGGKASEGFGLLTDHSPVIRDTLTQPGWRGLRQKSENFTLRHVWGSWSTDTGHEMSRAKLMHFLFNLLYGGGHLTAWNSSAFPTETERLLWQISGVVVASLFVYGSIWILFWQGVRSSSRLLTPIRRGDLNIVMGPAFAALILLYFLARCYFFIEALISLRSLPASAYQTVQWANFLPHSS